MTDQELNIEVAKKSGWTNLNLVPRIENGVQVLAGRSPLGSHGPLPLWLTSVDAALKVIGVPNKVGIESQVDE